MGTPNEKKRSESKEKKGRYPFECRVSRLTWENKSAPVINAKK